MIALVKGVKEVAETPWPMGPRLSASLDFDGWIQLSAGNGGLG